MKAGVTLRTIISIAIAVIHTFSCRAYTPSAIDSLALRVTEGTSNGRIFFYGMEAEYDSFRIVPDYDKQTITIYGNSPVSQAVGLNTYLKDVAKIHICWNNPSQALPEDIPLPTDNITGITTMPLRYYLNYCTFSYSTAFWDKQRWMQEIDWMALHGINMPLAVTGTEKVWLNVLERLGYDSCEAKAFIAGPPYSAWWLMNNLEGWGGPVSDEWVERQYDLQRAILSRMKSFGMHPVLPGYSGMLPHDAATKLGVDVSDPGLWCGFTRPAFISPDSHAFSRIADIYYDELTKLYGQYDFYSADPFHEGGNTSGVDMVMAGQAILNAMRRANSNAKWVIQAWQENPNPQMIDSLPDHSAIILDLYAETHPQWGDSDSAWYRKDGFGKHDWIYCMLLNFGGNVGLHGRIDKLTKGFRRAEKTSPHLYGIGATAEGIDNNPVMYELLFDLPWDISSRRGIPPLQRYITTRYALQDSIPTDILKAWRLLESTVCIAPAEYPGQGTVESIICARPSWDIKGASTWGNANLFYPSDSTSLASNLLSQESGTHLKTSTNYIYDLADIKRQALSDKVYDLYKSIRESFFKGDIRHAKSQSDSMLQIISEVDSLLYGIPGFSTEEWLRQAALASNDKEQKRRNVRNAARLITVWGDSAAANTHGLKDYSHRLWHGITSELYYRRWKSFFDHIFNDSPTPDFYDMEIQWIEKQVERYAPEK